MADPMPSEKESPGLTTGALKATPATDADETTASPTVGELAEGEVPNPDAQVPDGGVSRIGQEEPVELSAESLFDSSATARIVVLWVLTPTLSVVGSYVLFSFIT